MVARPLPPNDERTLRVNLAQVDSVNLYEITENELETMENGPPTHDLNFAISLFTISITVAIALVTSGFKSERAELIFIIVGIIAFIASLYLVSRWWQANKSFKKVASSIRGRKHSNTDRAPGVPEFQSKQPEFKTAELLMNIENALAKHQSAFKNKSEK